MHRIGRRRRFVFRKANHNASGLALRHPTKLLARDIFDALVGRKPINVALDSCVALAEQGVFRLKLVLACANPRNIAAP